MSAPAARLPKKPSLASERLAAAAPDLLGALERYHETFGELLEGEREDIECMACAAIAKARGEQ